MEQHVDTEVSKFEAEEEKETTELEESEEEEKKKPKKGSRKISKFEAEKEKETTELEESEDEEKKKSKKGSRKGRKKNEDRPGAGPQEVQETKSKEQEPIFNVTGLKNVKLTSLTQKIMGCIVGEHVTAEAPWTTINKVVVDENLYLHHESSDFLPVKDDLLEYSASTILVGYDANYLPYEGEDLHRFYIAVTESARDHVMACLEEEKRLEEERLKNSINKRILPWTSLGSEAEVDEGMVKNTRPLIQIELETDIDELLKPVNFSDREVNDVKDGYVRIGPGRYEFEGVTRLRVDAAVQSVPSLTPNTAQTDPGLPTNAWTQYLYDMDTAKEALQNSEVKELKGDHVFPEKEYLERTLEYNENFDLYVNDYPLLVLKDSDNEVPHKSFFSEYEAFTDVQHSKNKLISAIAWHPMVSGLVALSYSFAVRCVTAADIETTGDEVNRDVFSKNSVLLWSFKNALKPLLILESPREVHALAWSPVDPNLLIGGCVNGQIIIWDLTGKVEAVEGHEYLTPDQQRYRLVLHSLIGWLRPQPPAQYVRPAALSNLQLSHQGRVTKIQWLPPMYEWTGNGHLVKTEVSEGKTSMQFLSSGEDGVVMVWDLGKTPDDLAEGGRPRRRKVRKRPSALTAQISPYKAYDRKLRPIYMLFPELRGKSATKLTSLSFRCIPLKYVSVEPPPEYLKEEQADGSSTMVGVKEAFGESEQSVQKTQTDSRGITDGKYRKEVEAKKEEKEEKEKEEEKEEKEEEEMEDEEDEKNDPMTIRKKYVPLIEAPEVHPLQLLQVTSDDGDSLTLKWEGFDFHKGEMITTEQGVSVSWGAYAHDGPVVACLRSPFMEDLVLTIGGRVIALWTHQLKDMPLFWKNSPVGVTCGSWSPFRPCLFHVGRSDGSVEVWDLAKCSDSPTIVQSISGKVLTFMSEHSLPLSGNKAILGIADYNNSFRLLCFPEEFITPKPNELEILRELVQREVSLRQNYLEWNERFIKSNAEELARIRAKEEEAEKMHRAAEQAAEEEAQLRARLEEEEAKQLAKGRPGKTLSDRFIERLKQEREKQMQRVLMEKKRLDKSDLMAKQEPILMMKQMEKAKRRKQREKIRHQQKIFDKTVAMLFPEVIEKPKEDLQEMKEFEADLMANQTDLLKQYDHLLNSEMRFIRENPFNKRLKWEKVFEEGMFRRNVLDFPLYLRRNRLDRYMGTKTDGQGFFSLATEGKKGRVGFKEYDDEELEEEALGEGEYIEEEDIQDSSDEDSSEDDSDK